MSYEKCPKCRDYGFLDSHRCNPIWEVYPADEAAADFLGVSVGECVEVRAADEGTAADKASRDADSHDCEYDLASGRIDPVRLRVGAKVFEVDGATVVHYSAMEVDGA